MPVDRRHASLWVVTAVLGIVSLHLLGVPFLPESAVIAPPAILDTDNRQLTQAQCVERYPDLYLEADRAKRYFQSGISLQMVDAAEKDGASARVAIVDNKMYVKAVYWGINTRTQAILAAIYSALITSPEPMPDVDLVIQTSDAGDGKHPHFALDRKANQPNLWLMPDFGFFSWPEPGVGAYTEVRAKTEAYERRLGGVNSTWASKIPKLLWRGVPMVSIREVSVHGRTSSWQDLLKGSAGQPWSDVQTLDWANAEGLKSPAEHCEYQFLAHVEGYAYSGRLKYLQQCRSVIVTHPLQYIQHYHHLFDTDDDSPTQNMVEVPVPLEKHLPGVMARLTDPDNVEWVERIAENSWNRLRQGYISPAANDCYWRYVLRAYASVQSFQPEIGGAPYESYLLMGETSWKPH